MRKRISVYRWTVGVLALAVIAGGAVALAHGYGRDEGSYYGPFMGQLPSELEEAILKALDAEYTLYAAYDAVLAQYGELEPFFTLRKVSEHNIEALREFLEQYQVDYLTTNPYADTVELPGTLSEIAATLARQVTDKALVYEDILKTTNYRGISRLFAYLEWTSLKVELPTLELAAKSGGELDPAQVARLGLGNERGRYGPYEMMEEEDDHCPMWHGMWGGHMGMRRHPGDRDCH